MIAIDIVLLLPNDLVDKAIIENESLPEIRGQYRLNKKNCVPHITIAMAVIEDEHLEVLEKELQQTIFSSLYTFQLSNGYQLGNAIGWNIKKTATLHQLHLEAMAIIQKYTIHPDVEIYSDCLYPTSYIHYRYETINYLKSFAHKYAFEHYEPHITIGLGNIPPQVESETVFISDGLALFHLGNLNTCVKMISKW